MMAYISRIHQLREILTKYSNVVVILKYCSNVIIISIGTLVVFTVIQNMNIVSITSTYMLDKKYYYMYHY